MNPDTKLCHQQQEWPLPDRLHGQHFQFLQAQLYKIVVGNIIIAAATKNYKIQLDYVTIRPDDREAIFPRVMPAKNHVRNIKKGIFPTVYSYKEKLRRHRRDEVHYERLERSFRG